MAPICITPICITVSIAFRRSVFSRHGRATQAIWIALGLHCLSAFSVLPTYWSVGVGRFETDSLHCLSAFSVLPTPTEHSRQPRCCERLHCLSAFSVLPTLVSVGLKPTPGPKSPLPFGVQCSPDEREQFPARLLGQRSPLPFGVQCSPDLIHLRPLGSPPTVSIAFRRSVFSRRCGDHPGLSS